MAETKARLYKRSTAEKKLNELLDRVEKLNSNQDGTHNYVYYVKRLVVFGSYLDDSRDKVHDLDIGFEIRLKEQFKGKNLVELAKTRERDMPEYFKRAIYDHVKVAWLEEEVLRFLKKSSVMYSFHTMDREGEYKIITGGKHKIIYDIDAEGERERLWSIYKRNKDDIDKNIFLENCRYALEDLYEAYDLEMSDKADELRLKYWEAYRLIEEATVMFMTKLVTKFGHTEIYVDKLVNLETKIGKIVDKHMNEE